MNTSKLLLILSLLTLVTSASAQTPTNNPTLCVGAEVLLSSDCPDEALAPLANGNRIAVVANHTSLVGHTHLVDTLLSLGFNVTKIFCPEHGFRGTADAGASVSNSVDSKTSLPIISLYGKNKKPSPEQMSDIDCLIFDLQDVGCRFYTYISTMHYAMEACAERGIPILVLDRPNPNRSYVDGPVLDTAKFKSFVGMHPVPIVYGLTIGEYALMINGEGWLSHGQYCDLRVLPMTGYVTDSLYDLPVPPSPNLRNRHAIALYPSLCLFEGTNVSVGRGTDHPFEIIGLPLPLSTINDGNAQFRVGDNLLWGKFFSPKGKEMHYGLDLTPADVPKKFDLSYLQLMYAMTKRGKFFLSNNFFEKLAGTSDLRRQLETGASEEEIRSSWEPQLSRYLSIRQKYILYE